MAQRSHGRARARRRHTSVAPRSATEAAPMSGWIGANTVIAPLTPRAATMILLQIGQPMARKEATPPRVARPPPDWSS